MAHASWVLASRLSPLVPAHPEVLPSHQRSRRIRSLPPSQASPQGVGGAPAAGPRAVAPVTPGVPVAVFLFIRTGVSGSLGHRKPTTEYRQSTTGVEIPQTSPGFSRVLREAVHRDQSCLQNTLLLGTDYIHEDGPRSVYRENWGV